MNNIKVFDYIEELDCFVANLTFKSITDYLGITEWNAAVWIGRFFTLDNDYGEHWFDNWDLRESIENKAIQLGFESQELFIIDPKRFINGKDGPCHSDAERKIFWTDVCKSLALSLDLIFIEARNFAKKESDLPLIDIEKRILEIQNKYIN